MNKFNKFEEMQALLEMIAPTEEELVKNRNAGGMVSYRLAKDFYDLATEYVDILEEMVDISGIHCDHRKLEIFKKKHNL